MKVKMKYIIPESVISDFTMRNKLCGESVVEAGINTNILLMDQTVDERSFSNQDGTRNSEFNQIWE